MYVVKTKDKGRAVYASPPTRLFDQYAYSAGDVIEKSDVVLFPQKETPDETIIAYYAFQWDEETLALSFGKSSLFNHSDDPNVGWHIDKEKVQLIFYALRNINPHEELTIRYGYEEMLSKEKAAFARGDINNV